MAIFKKKTSKAAEPVAAEEAVVTAASKTAPKAAKKTKAVKETAADIIKAQPAAVSELSAKTLLAPLVTEKTAHLAHAGVYAFRVPLMANRVAVRAAFKSLYKVSPASVRIMRVHGKEKVRGRVSARLSDWKKALITVPAGTRVDIFTL